ncbi:PREDICTED: uncharacterized protein LOC109188019 isoform X2 [Ipomoea nil]|uniref:uncharacterized protein LOC109188019 isoform X2 n=1 Tax=Ipomoea nil TaxID=35883 RepID=UPI000900D26E|nr:PREDICTED: uncharacterized protein LOC109188019 isoform X2 [Ipomoea nil]
MSSERHAVTVRDLADEAKKRIVFLIVCVVGLSYLMSLTSSSVLVNLPAAVLLIILLRYLSLDFEARRKAANYKGKSFTANSDFQSRQVEGPKNLTQKSEWRKKVSSPVVEEAIDQFTRHIVSEWVTDLWYSRITPDRQGPEELVQIMNSVLGEISCRMRNVNLIDLLLRDSINCVCSHLELFRVCKVKIEKQHSRSLTIEERDMELKSVLAAENKLHPALFSPEAEHKVLQHLMDGLISLTFKPEDLQCSLFRYIVRELLACVVMRPVLNLANPRFINERIEILVASSKKTVKVTAAAQVKSQSKTSGFSKVSSDDFSPFIDPSVKGVELVQLKKDQSDNSVVNNAMHDMNGTEFSKDPLLSIDTRSTRSWSNLPTQPHSDDGRLVQRHHSGGEWGDMLDVFSHRKAEALAPEHFDNMWAKGRNYKRKEDNKHVDDPTQQSSIGTSKAVSNSQAITGQNGRVGENREDDEHDDTLSDEDVPGSSSYSTEGEETSVGLGSPVVKVWDGKNKRNVTRIHHPLESRESQKSRRKGNKGQNYSKRLSKTSSGWKRSRLSSQKDHVWQEIERTSFLSGDGHDILNSSKDNLKHEQLSDDSGAEMSGRIASGTTATSSVSTSNFSKNHNLDTNTAKTSIIADAFLKLRCEVLSASIVKSGTTTFAVYSISVTDAYNNNWSIKRRFRHFEELHRRLKEFSEYNLHLPPKHFFSTGLDVPVIRERCKLLDMYLKKLLQHPTISNSIEVWDFLSVDSQTYSFSNSLSIIETLSVLVDLDESVHERNKEHMQNISPRVDPLSSNRGCIKPGNKDLTVRVKPNHVVDASRLNYKYVPPIKKAVKENGKAFEDSSSDSDNMAQKNKVSSSKIEKAVKVCDATAHVSPELLVNTADDPTLPSEWVPPNLSVPILDMVDVVLQLHDGGWIRRQAFWIAKQVLQLGMGDAFDDWLIEKIQLLRQGSVVATGIKRIEQILWPDGIFITKHPKRQRPVPTASPSNNSSPGQPSTPLSSPKMEEIQKLDEMQQEEAVRRAKLVYELMIDKAPAAIVGLVGRKEYEQCAKDLYFFIQSSVCLKQLAYDLVELLLSSAFPELDYVFREFREEKGNFGVLRVD